MSSFKQHEDLLKAAAKALGPLLEKVAFVGGSTTILHLTEKIRDIRATTDVDVIIGASLTEFYQAEETLRSLGFQPDPELICRHRKGDLIIDFMPTDSKVLGFSSRWYADGLRQAQPRKLGSTEIKVLTFPHFVATKLEAFNGRGHGDYYGSKDIEDIVTVFAGRPAFLGELKQVKGELGTFIRSEIRRHLAEDDFSAAVKGHMPRDPGMNPARMIADLREIAEVEED